MYHPLQEWKGAHWTNWSFHWDPVNERHHIWLHQRGKLAMVEHSIDLCHHILLNNNSILAKKFTCREGKWWGSSYFLTKWIRRMGCHSTDHWASYPLPEGKELVSFQGQINYFLLKLHSFNQVLRGKKDQTSYLTLPIHRSPGRAVSSQFIRFSLSPIMRTHEGLENGGLFSQL
jgi:hypothetical protein